MRCTLLCLIACGDALTMHAWRATLTMHAATGRMAGLPRHGMCSANRWSTVEPGELDLALLREWMRATLQTTGTELRAMAGVLSIYCADERFVLRGAHMHGAAVDLEGEFVDKWSEGEARESKLVFMGSNLDPEALQRGLRGCVVSPAVLEKKRKALRFAVGDAVECRTQSGWAKGTVVDLLYREDSMPPGLVAPYQLRLEEDDALIFAPEDSNEVIRAKKLERLRFAVDDEVECNLGDRWSKGKVVSLMYREPDMPPGFVAPYQVELEESGSTIYAPSDSKELIRKRWRFFDP